MVYTVTEKWQSLADCNGLENRRTERYREFESHPLRHFLLTANLINSE